MITKVALLLEALRDRETPPAGWLSRYGGLSIDADEDTPFRQIVDEYHVFKRGKEQQLKRRHSYGYSKY